MHLNLVKLTALIKRISSTIRVAKHQWVAATLQGAASPIGSNSGFSVLPKGSTLDWEAGFDLPNHSVIEKEAL